MGYFIKINPHLTKIYNTFDNINYFYLSQNLFDRRYLTTK